MNRLLKLLSITLLIATISTPAMAQTLVPSSEPMVNEFIENHETPRSQAWWNALGRQLTLTLDRPVTEVKEVDLQNVIYFATHFRKQVKLKDASSLLMGIYEMHPDEDYRIMALAAMSAISDHGSMAQLKEKLAAEESERVKRLTIAALVSYYR